MALPANPSSRGPSPRLNPAVRTRLERLVVAVDPGGGCLVLLGALGVETVSVRADCADRLSELADRRGAELEKVVLSERRFVQLDDELGILMAVPLEASGRVLGLLAVVTGSTPAAADVYEVTAAAAQVAALIERGQPAGRVPQPDPHLLLLEAAETINSSLDSSSLEATILAEASRLVGAQKAALLLVKGDVLVAQESLGLSDRCREVLVVPLQGSAFGRAVVDGETVVVEGNGDGASGIPSGACDAEWSSMLVAPLQSHSATFGALALFDVRPRRYGEGEKALVRTFAIQAGIALDNRRLMQEKDRMAVRDGLTGVYNRSYLELALDRTAKELHRNGGTASVLFIDVDGMKRANDTYGHQAGDQLLVQLGTLLEDCCRETDVVARYGGDEFVVLMPGTDEEGARQVALKIDAALARHNESHSLPWPLSASAGTHTAGAADIEDLLREADRRMYAAKRTRRVAGSEGEALAPDGDAIVPEDEAPLEEEGEAEGQQP